MIAYILKVSLCWGIFYGFYRLLLSRETFFRSNRLYLLATLVLSLLLPLITLPTNDYITDEFAIDISNLSIMNSTTPSEYLGLQLSISSLISMIYIIGVLVSSFRFLKAIFEIIKLSKTGTKHDYEDYTLVNTSAVDAPFSFFNLLFINDLQFENNTQKQYILKHEIAHIKGKHSLDRLLLEILGIVFWFNPLVFFYGKSLRNIHEYLADAEVLRSTNKKYYGKLLLQQTFGNIPFSITNNFNSQLKKRIQMMTKNPSSNRIFWKYALVLPLMIAVFMTISTESVFAQKKAISDLSELEEKPSYAGCTAAEGFKCTVEKLTTYLTSEIQYPKEAKKAKIEGKVVVSFVIDKKGNVIDVVAENEVGGGCTEEALRVVKGMPAWNPGIKSGKKVKVMMKLPIQFALPKQKQ